MNSETKKCPMCAEEIKAEAKICRFCGARFEVTLKGYCTNCHTIVDADEVGKCKQCQTEVVDRHTESKLISQSAPQPAPEKVKETPATAPQAQPVENVKIAPAPSKATDKDVLPVGTCAKCGLQTEGRYYQYYYGWKTDQKSSSTFMPFTGQPKNLGI